MKMHRDCECNHGKNVLKTGFEPWWEFDFGKKHKPGGRIKKVLHIVGDRAKYYADLSKKYFEDVKEICELVKYYASLNTNVTVEYVVAQINTLWTRFETVINSYVLQSQLKDSFEEFAQQGNYVDSDTLDKAVSGVIPSQAGNNGKVLGTNGENLNWVDISTKADTSTVNTQLNGKADTSLSNINATAKDLIANLSSPSTRYTDLALGASNASITAPGNGYVYMNFQTETAGSYICGLMNSSLSMGMRILITVKGLPVSVYIPVSKGQSFCPVYNTTITKTAYRFVYTNGAS